MAWNKTAETICRYLHKGSKVGITGRIDTREYTDKNSNKRKSFEIIADSAHFVESKGAGQAEPQGEAQVSFAQKQEGVEDFADIEDDGDSLPF